MENVQLMVNEELSRFRLRVDGYTALLKYKIIGNNLFLTHTAFPESLKAKRIGNAIVEKALRYASEKKCAVVPICPFVQAYLQRHPEWREIISTDADRFIPQKK